MKILIVLTGGTIASRSGEDAIRVEAGMGMELVRLYRKEYGGEGIDFKFSCPYYILSENSTPEHWTLLSEAFSGFLRSGFDGIIVTHGSDTLSYTSALLGILYGRAEIPIIVTASGAPLGEPGSNGLANFACAVSFIQNSGLSGVFTIYQKETGEQSVYLSTRLIEADAYLDEFQSFGGAPFGRMEAGRFFPQKSPVNPSAAELRRRGNMPLKKPVSFQRPICYLRPYPGLDYSAVVFSRPPAAILHGLYHSGTACAGDGASSLPAFISRCADKGIPVYAGPVKSGGKLYETGLELKKAGAVFLRNLSPEAAYAKLCVAYNQHEMSPEAFLNLDCFYETLPDRVIQGL